MNDGTTHSATGDGATHNATGNGAGTYTAPPTGPQLEQAIDLATRGLPLFRLVRDTKDQFIDVGWNRGEATDDLMDVFERFSSGEYNIGIACGEKILVLDVDTSNGKQGEQAIAEFWKRVGIAEPETLTFRTQSGGRHLVFKTDGNLYGQSDLVAGCVNVRAIGGYIVAPPSRFKRADGTYGDYSILRDAPILSIPPELHNELQRRATEWTGHQIVCGDLFDDEIAREAATNYAKAAKPAIEGQSGDRHTVNVARRCFDYGVSEQTAFEILSEHFNPRCLPTWDDDALKVKIENAWKYPHNHPIGHRHPALGFDALSEDLKDYLKATGQAPQADPIAHIRFMRVSDFAKKPRPERDWYLAGMMPARQPTLLYGDGATGKSLLAGQMCVSTAALRPFLGMEVKGGPAIYIGAEDDYDEMHIRFDDICKGYGISLADLRDLHLLCLIGEECGAVLGATNRNNIVEPTALWKRLRGMILDIKPAFVAFDTLSDLFAGNENNRSEARQFIGMIKGLCFEARCSAVLLAHPSLQGMATGTGTSGSTGWSNSVRSRMYFTRQKHKENGKDIEVDPDARTLSVMKVNYAPQGADGTRVRWQNGLFVPDDGTITGARSTAHDDMVELLFLDLVRAFGKQKRRITSSHASGYAPKLFAADPRGKNVGKKDFEKAMNNLFAKERIRIVPTGPPSRPDNTIVVVET